MTSLTPAVDHDYSREVGDLRDCLLYSRDVDRRRAAVFAFEELVRRQAFAEAARIASGQPRAAGGAG